jgi:hypothetical protein
MLWVQSKGSEFNAAGPRILAGRAAAADIARALPRGTPERAAAGETVDRWSDMLSKFYAARNRWNAVAERVPGLEGLGIVPVVPLALAATVIAVAGSMALVLRRLTAEERIVRGLERGTLTPAQAVQLAANIEGGKPGLLGAIGGGALVPLALAGAAAWFFMGRR